MWLSHRKVQRVFAVVVVVAPAVLMSVSGEEVVTLVDNWRKVQPAFESRRAIYRSAATAAACVPAAECDDDLSASSMACVTTDPGASTGRDAEVHEAKTDEHHWSYDDQDGWWKWHDPVEHRENECGALTQRESELFETATQDAGGSYPGESPVDIDPSDAIAVDFTGDVLVHVSTEESSTSTTSTVTTTRTELKFDLGVWLADNFQDSRRVTVRNTGHAVVLDVCGYNAYDCKATGNFGSWPKALRGVLNASAANDTYYLRDVTFHWGSSFGGGSEHLVCDAAAAAEMQFRFANTDATLPTERSDPASGAEFVILAVFLREGESTNHAFKPVFDAVATPSSSSSHDTHRRLSSSSSSGTHDDVVTGVVRVTNESAASAGDVILLDLLPPSYATRFYSYAGSLTEPPCSQTATWFVLEEAMFVSGEQLKQLRESRTVVHGEHGHSHSFKALLFPFVAIAMGTLTQHFLSRHAPSVPYTMCVMLEGFILDCLASINNEGRLNSMQESLKMWADIDGHLVLYAFLPALLFGDVMSLNVHVFEKVFWQALLLAGPGVVAGAAITALFVKYTSPYDDWSFSLCMTLGSVLAATDPVAVVSLLKAVGASATLTMQITGESLLNDGSAMVLFTIFFDVARDKPYDVIEVVRFFARMVFLSPVLGLLIGAVATFWMSKASSRHSESDTLVQLAVTLCCAYLAFFLGESTVKTSGILTTVAAGLVLAYRAWPFVVSHEAMEHVWHAVEYLGNTLIFALAGVLTRRATFSNAIRGREYLYCVVLYVGVVVVRAVMLLLLYPILKNLSDYGATPRDAAFMVWGGLRGAVGLALALFVKQILHSNSNDKDEERGDRFLFYVAGVALLTLVVNAPTSRFVLKTLKLIGIDNEERQLVTSIKLRISAAARREYVRSCLRFDRDAVDILEYIPALRNLRGTPDARPVQRSKQRAAAKKLLYHKAKFARDSIRKALKKGFAALYVAAHYADDDDTTGGVTATTTEKKKKKKTVPRSFSILLSHREDEPEDEDRFAHADSSAALRAIAAIVEDENAAKEEDGEYCRREGVKHGYEVAKLEGRVRALCDGSRGNATDDPCAYCDLKRLSHLRETFLRVLKAQYWDMIDEGLLPRKAVATLALLHSVDSAIDDADAELNDYRYLRSTVERDVGNQCWDHVLDGLDTCLPSWFDADNVLHEELNYRQHEFIYYALRAFCEAHARAQTKIAEFFGGTVLPADASDENGSTGGMASRDDDDEKSGRRAPLTRVTQSLMDTIEEVTVVLESARQVQQAAVCLDAVAPKLKEAVKSNIVADSVIEVQHEAIHTLIVQGVLSQVEAESILDDLRDQELKIKALRRARLRLVAQATVDQDFERAHRRRAHVLGLVRDNSLDDDIADDAAEVKRARKLAGQLSHSALGAGQHASIDDDEEAPAVNKAAAEAKTTTEDAA